MNQKACQNFYEEIIKAVGHVEKTAVVEILSEIIWWIEYMEIYIKKFILDNN